MATTLTSNIPFSIRAIYSKEIIHQAQPRLRFSQFAKKKNDEAVDVGGVVKFTKYNNIQRGGKLTEGVNMNEKAMSNSEVALTIEEYGNAVIVSEKALRQSIHNELQEASIALANDMAIVLDNNMRDVALTTSNQLYGNGVANAASLVAGSSVFNTQTVKNAAESLATNNAPKIDGQYYICIAHPHQLRQIRDDSAWINAHSYVGIENIYKGEVGMYEGVRFVETTQMPVYSAAQSLANFGVNVPTWESVIFGENSFGWAEGLPVEMRDNGIQDYGRMHGIAWYAMWGFGLIEEKNIFSILTA